MKCDLLPLLFEFTHINLHSFKNVIVKINLIKIWIYTSQIYKYSIILTKWKLKIALNFLLLYFQHKDKKFILIPISFLVLYVTQISI